MRMLFLSLFILSGCAEVELGRRPATEHLMRFGEISHRKSLVQIFPAVIEDGSLVYYFYLQLRDEEGKYVDCDPSEIGLKFRKGKSVEFKTERLLVGRYYLTITNVKEVGTGSLSFYVRGRVLKEQFRLNMQKPDKDHTKMTVVKKGRGEMTIRLRLADKTNRPVEIPEAPEILFEGIGEIKDLRHIHEGIWEFTLSYGEFNQIFYFSVRAQGIYFPKLLRYQHIEK